MTGPAAKAAELRRRADLDDDLATRHPRYAQEADRLRARADSLEAGQLRTPEDFVEDYNDEAARLHTIDHVAELVEHAERWRAEIHADAYSRALGFLASAHGNLEANGEREAARIVAGWLRKAHADLHGDSP